jgi:hypothetical protein
MAIIAPPQSRGPTDTALAGVLQTQAQQPAQMFAPYASGAANMFGTLGGMYQTGMGTMGQMFNSYANAFGSYGNAIGNIAGNASQARANENAGRYAAYAGGLDSYTGMMGNLGSAALAGYGSAANAAMQMAAARDTAAMKAMSDMVAANQSASAQYGAGRDQSLAGIANAYANAGGSLGNARANMGNAAANLAGAGSGALANLGTGIAGAAANASSGTGQSQTALAAALANALSGVTAGEQSALTQNNAASANALAGILSSAAGSQAGLGNAAAALGGSLGGNITNAASNSLNYTRDMAKLDLARLLGIAGTNVASQGMANLPGQGTTLTPLGSGFTISGPGGLIASGSGPAAGQNIAGAVGGGSAPIYMDPAANAPWYSGPQVSDGGAMTQLGALRDQSFGALGGIAGDVRGQAAGGQSQLASQFDRAGAGIASSSAAGRSQLDGLAGQMGSDIRNAFNASSNRINTEGDAGRVAILAALADGNNTISGQAAGLNDDAASAMSGINRSREDVVGSGVLDSLNRNFQSGFGTLADTYREGRQDPRTLLQDVLTSTQALANPYLSAGRDAFGTWMGGFPGPLDPALGGGGFLDPVPYLSALQAGWSPFRGELTNAFYNQNANVLGMLQSGRQDYFGSLGNLNNQYDGAIDWADSAALKPQIPPAPLPGGTFGPVTVQPLNRNLANGQAFSPPNAPPSLSRDNPYGRVFRSL